MKTRFHKVIREPLQLTQGVRKKKVRVQLNKEAHVALCKHRKESAQHYYNAMKNTWSKINETLGDLAMAHHKPLQCVEADLYMRGQLVWQHHQKTNSWNAFLWYQSQESGNENDGKFSFLFLFS